MDFKHLLDFLARLSKNNTKEWFDANKKEYDSLRKEWIGFVGECITTIGSFDKRFASLDPKKCIFRINRDIRFSKDKSPYKNNFGMSLSLNDKKEEFCGYYLHIQPNNCFIAGGSYMPMPDTLAKIRQEIDYNLPAFKKIVLAKDFKSLFGEITGEKLVRPPKGYDAENPAIEYLKLKGFIAERKLTHKELSDAAFVKTFAETAKSIRPLIDFLSVAIDS